MYFKTPDSRSKADIRVPLGYKGNAFPSPSQPKPSTSDKAMPIPSTTPKMSETAFEKLKEAPLPAPSETPPTCEVCEISDKCEVCELKKNTPQKKSLLGGILSPEGSLDAEELLILALALIVFQGGKENELALLLLALLFIK